MKRKIWVLFLFIPFHSLCQQISCSDTSISAAYALALKTVDMNTRNGVLAAGGDYGGEWTRDIAINTWNGVNLLRPQLAENSIWSVTIHKDTIGHQYWDKIIWVIAAYNLYLANGDMKFLKQAYTCSSNTMKQLEMQAFDNKYGLFTGPSVFNDGIAGYPEPIFDPSNKSSSVLDHPSVHIKCLSTNCVYYGAYKALDAMDKILNKGKTVNSPWLKKASNLKGNILKHLYDGDRKTFYYLIDQNGKPYPAQEGLGISFAVIFGVIDQATAKKTIQNAITSQYGITSIYPDFPRYSEQNPGRHNNIVWPMVNGFFAKAAIEAKAYTPFNKELYSLTHLALDTNKGNGDFKEIYNPYSGKPDGGWQCDTHWKSCKAQTWSATAYISMVQNGLMGFRLKEHAILFQPYLPQGIKFVEIKNLSYRNCNLNIKITGSGNTIKAFRLDGKLQKDNSVSARLDGNHLITIELG